MKFLRILWKLDRKANDSDPAFELLFSIRGIPISIFGLTVFYIIFFKLIPSDETMILRKITYGMAIFLYLLMFAARLLLNIIRVRNMTNGRY